jgi:hypothetical protein
MERDLLKNGDLLYGGTRGKAELNTEITTTFSGDVMNRVFEVSESGFYEKQLVA